VFAEPRIVCRAPFLDSERCEPRKNRTFSPPAAGSHGILRPTASTQRPNFDLPQLSRESPRSLPTKKKILEVETTRARPVTEPFEYLTKEIFALVSAYDFSHTHRPDEEHQPILHAESDADAVQRMLAVARVRPSRITGHRARAELREGTGRTEGRAAQRPATAPRVHCYRRPWAFIVALCASKSTCGISALLHGSFVWRRGVEGIRGRGQLYL
jgi:hypothetical protein